MPGTITFKPIEANLSRDTDIIGKADPYCMFTVGGQKIKGPVCKSGGTHPVWNEVVTISTADQPSCLVEIKDKDILKDEKMGSVEIDLQQIEARGSVRQWFPLYNEDQPAGEILMEAIYTPDVQSQGFGMGRQTGGLPTGSPIVLNSPTVVTKEVRYINEIPVSAQSNVIYPEPQVSQLSGGYIPTATYSTMSPGIGYREQYAQEAVIRGADPYGTQLQKLSTPYISESNLASVMPLPRLASDTQGFSAPNYGNTGTHYHSQSRQSQQMVFGHGRSSVNPMYLK